MKDFAIEEKQMYLEAHRYWDKVEKRAQRFYWVCDRVAEVGVLALVSVLVLFLLVQ